MYVSNITSLANLATIETKQKNIPLSRRLVRVYPPAGGRLKCNEAGLRSYCNADGSFSVELPSSLFPDGLD